MSPEIKLHSQVSQSNVLILQKPSAPISLLLKLVIFIWPLRGRTRRCACGRQPCRLRIHTCIRLRSLFSNSRETLLITRKADRMTITRDCVALTTSQSSSEFRVYYPSKICTMHTLKLSPAHWAFLVQPNEAMRCTAACALKEQSGRQRSLEQ